MATFVQQADDKLVNIIEKASASNNDKPWISIEFFPPKTEEGIPTLWKCLDKLQQHKPLFADFTWGAGGSTSELTLDLCIKAKKEHNIVPNMHLTCTNVEKEKLDEALETCKREGITNIVALRGDPPVGQEKWEATDLAFTCALDLVKYIRKEHGSFFNLSVAGYPEGHPNQMSVIDDGIDSLSESEKKRCSITKDENGKETVIVCKDADFENDMKYLKEKVDAGADCIITQMFFDADVFGDFVTKCRSMGINVPIIPGIMMLSNLGGFRRMTGFCKSRVPPSMVVDIEAIEAECNALGDDGPAALATKIKEYGIKTGAELCQKIIKLGAAGLHFYTLNQSATTLNILDALGYVPAV